MNVNVIDIDKELIKDIVNVVTKEKGTKKKTKIESTEIANRGGANNVREAEVKTFKKTEKSKSNN